MGLLFINFIERQAQQIQVKIDSATGGISLDGLTAWLNGELVHLYFPSLGRLFAGGPSV